MPESTYRNRLDILHKSGAIIITPLKNTCTYIAIVNYLNSVNEKVVPVTNPFKYDSADKIQIKKRSYDQHMKPQIKVQPKYNHRTYNRTTESQPEDTINKDKENKYNKKINLLRILIF